jgi:hypothetical protein
VDQRHVMGIGEGAIKRSALPTARWHPVLANCCCASNAVCQCSSLVGRYWYVKRRSDQSCW